MRVHIAIDNRFLLKSGVIYDTYTQDSKFWSDYLSTFEEIVVVGRAKEVREVPRSAHRVTREDIHFERVPYWEGAADWISKRWRVKRRLRQIAEDVDAAVLRVPGMVGAHLGTALRKCNTPYAVEVTQNPEGAYPRLGIVSNLVDWYLQYLLKQTVANARAVSYVTAQALQEEYPAPQAEVTSHYSSIRLPDDLVRATPRCYNEIPDPLNLIHVGGMFNGRKGQEVILEALTRLRSTGVDARVRFVGDGPLREKLVSQAEELSIGDVCRFHGNVPRAKVFDLLDLSDMFVLPSQSEGLPRALLEAMARGLPCLATPVGGIPEVLSDNALISSEPGEIAKAILRFQKTPSQLAKASRRNLEVAEEYTEEKLKSRRIRFYQSYCKSLNA